MEIAVLMFCIWLYYPFRTSITMRLYDVNTIFLTCL